jgi:RNA polymerase sigma-70 factor (ECF subfamily)
MGVETTDGAFEAMFRAHHDDLYRYAVRRVGPDAAADVVAEVFLVAWHRRADIPADAARLWLFGVASNRVLKEYRSAGRRAGLSSRLASEARPPAPDPFEELDTVRLVQQALDRLPVSDQEALRLTQWDRLSTAEAAVVVGCSAPTFRVRLHRARRRFATALDAMTASSATSTSSEQDVIA